MLGEASQTQARLAGRLEISFKAGWSYFLGSGEPALAELENCDTCHRELFPSLQADLG